MRLWDPRHELGGLTEADCKGATLLLWKGHCSIHQRFTPATVAAFRAEHPNGIVVVHPEVPYETVQLADQVGSTDYIIRALTEAPTGSTVGVGTEIHLVSRLAQEHPDKRVVCLDPLICPCSTMNRIDPAHLCWVLEELVAGRVRNRITVDPQTAESARIALRRMLEIV
jgi:quinolinate synthase